MNYETSETDPRTGVNSSGTPYRISCAEIWGGVTVTDLDVCTRGLTASIQSTACGGGKGGDIYYFSVCGSDALTRIAVADVRGHGEAATPVSEWLYAALRERMNSLDGAGVLEELNGMVRRHGFEAMTTAAVVSYYTGDSNLYYSYAGHPPMLVQRNSGQWEAAEVPDGNGPSNLPLGVLGGVKYTQARRRFDAGDRLVIYTDGVVECPGEGGEFYGDERLREALNRAPSMSPVEIKRAVYGDLERYAGGMLNHDDCTLLVVEARLH
jgi:sigma-B regulation protein RsbU (phosphoserine phosphatase)